MGWLDDQVVLVTGGGSGIGRAVVARFVEEGARVGVMERVASRAEQLCAEFGGAVVGVSGDVSRIDDNRRAVAETVSAFGRLDTFVGNAGVFDVFASFSDLSDDKLDDACEELFGVNVKGCLFGAKVALPELRKTGGSMIFTASSAQKRPRSRVQRCTSNVQPIALAVGYEQEGLCWVALNLRTQPIDVRFQCVSGDSRIVTPDLMQELLAVHRTRIGAIEVFQYRRLFLGQPDTSFGDRIQ